jgi:hypothetical protein
MKRVSMENSENHLKLRDNIKNKRDLIEKTAKYKY